MGRLKSSFESPLCYLCCWAKAPSYKLMEPEDNINKMQNVQINQRKTNSRWRLYHIGWKVLKSVIKVVHTIFKKKPFSLSIRSGTCCIRGCTLIITSSWYFISPFATSLMKAQSRINRDILKGLWNLLILHNPL